MRSLVRKHEVPETGVLKVEVLPLALLRVSGVQCCREQLREKRPNDRTRDLDQYRNKKKCLG